MFSCDCGKMARKWIPLNKVSLSPCCNTELRDKANTSLLTFNNIKKNINNNERLVLEVIQKLGTATIHDVCECLEWPPNSVSGRLTGLKNKERIKDVGSRHSPSGNPSTIYECIKDE